MSEASFEDRYFERLQGLVDAAKKFAPTPTAVVYPCSDVALEGALDAKKEGLIEPILIGPQDKIEAIASSLGLSLAGVRIVSTADDLTAANQAAMMARDGEVKALMKGSLHTDVYLRAILNKEAGLRIPGNVLSQIFVLDIPTYKKLVFVSDAALNIAPSLEQKKQIAQNAINLAHKTGVMQPKLAFLSAVEEVNEKMLSSVEAAELAKSDISGGILAGPLAMDNAISAEAAKIKKIDSPVAGDADILIVPNIETGNVFVKSMVYLAKAETAGIVVGAKIPAVLTSRADSPRARLASAALASLIANN